MKIASIVSVQHQPNSVLALLSVVLATVVMLAGCSLDIDEPGRTAVRAAAKIAATTNANSGQNGSAVTVAATASTDDTSLAGAPAQANGADTTGVHAIPVALVAPDNALVV